MISDDYHNIVQLLLLMIIVNSKIVKKITVNRQNQLIAHPQS